MAPSSSTSQETGAKTTTTTTGLKRARTLDLDVNQDVFSLWCVPALKPIITRCSSEVESSNPAGDSSSSSSSCGITSDEESCNSNGLEECTTPKAAECRIPEVLSCPPAPKKRRPAARHRSAPSTGFFCPPELDLLFSPLHKISKSM